MQQHCSCLLCDVSYCLLCYAVLEVGVDAAVADGLIICVAVQFEGVVGKLTIVAMVVLDFDAMIICKAFKCLLCFDCLVRRHACHEMDVPQSRVVVDKYRG